MKSLIPWFNKNKPVPAHHSTSNDNALLNDNFDTSLWFGNDIFYNRLPSVDISEDRRNINVRVEIPGLDEKDIQLTWNKGILSIRGEKHYDKENKHKDYYYRECSYGSFSRAINIDKNVDWEQAHAKYKNGVLTVQLPKKESDKKTIEIKVN
jgi:HSP20 family protein